MYRVLKVKKQKAIEYFGSQQAIASALGLHKSAVSQWGVDVPELRAFQLKAIMEERDSKKVQSSNAA